MIPPIPAPAPPPDLKRDLCRAALQLALDAGPDTRLGLGAIQAAEGIARDFRARGRQQDDPAVCHPAACALIRQAGARQADNPYSLWAAHFLTRLATALPASELPRLAPAAAATGHSDIARARRALGLGETDSIDVQRLSDGRLIARGIFHDFVVVPEAGDQRPEASE